MWGWKKEEGLKKSTLLEMTCFFPPSTRTVACTNRDQQGCLCPFLHWRVRGLNLGEEDQMDTSALGHRKRNRDGPGKMSTIHIHYFTHHWPHNPSGMSRFLHINTLWWWITACLEQKCKISGFVFYSFKMIVHEMDSYDYKDLNQFYI